MQFKTISLAAIAAVAIAIPAWAHHSHANYEQNEWLELTGTVTEVQWMNPHVWVYMEIAKTDGTKSVWALEGGSVGALTRGGWARDSVQTGDTISVRCHALKDGSDGCLLGFLTTDRQGGVPKEFD